MLPHTKPHVILYERTEGYNSLIQYFLVASAVSEIQQDKNCTLKISHFGPLCTGFYEKIIYESVQSFMNPDRVLLRLSESILGKVLSSKLKELCSKPFCTLSTSVHMCRVWKVLNWSRYRWKNIKIRILIRKYLEISNPFSEFNYLQYPSIGIGLKMPSLHMSFYMTHPCSDRQISLFDLSLRRPFIGHGFCVYPGGVK